MAAKSLDLDFMQDRERVVEFAAAGQNAGGAFDGPELVGASKLRGRIEDGTIGGQRGGVVLEGVLAVGA